MKYGKNSKSKKTSQVLTCTIAIMRVIRLSELFCQTQKIIKKANSFDIIEA